MSTVSNVGTTASGSYPMNGGTVNPLLNVSSGKITVIGRSDRSL
jgi:hypothetical protein